MNRTVFNVFLVVAGAAIGSAVTWKVVTTKYERIVQEEIDSVKEEFKRLYEDREVVEEYDERENQNEAEYEEPVEDVFEPTNDEVFEYHNISSMYRSSEDETVEKGGEDEVDEAPYINGPYVISPDDFRCSPPGYNAQALDYFADGVLADSWGNEVDIEETIGEDSLDRFGDYVDDIVYVRNERKEIDYEVTCDSRRYEDVYGSEYNV